MIPESIHHVWPGEDPFRQNFHAWRLSWLRLHPDWSFTFWRLESTGDSRVDEILRDDSYTVVVKADILRYQLLKQFGGLYVDTDFECLRSFAGFMQDPKGCFFGMEPGDELPSPALIGAAPGHPFIAACLEEALKSLKSVSAEEANRKTHMVTGPYLMKRVISLYPDLAFTAHPATLFYPMTATQNGAAYAKHHWNHITGGERGWGVLRQEAGYAGIEMSQAPPSLFGKL